MRAGLLLLFIFLTLYASAQTDSAQFRIKRPVAELTATDSMSFLISINKKIYHNGDSIDKKDLATIDSGIGIIYTNAKASWLGNPDIVSYEWIIGVRDSGKVWKDKFILPATGEDTTQRKFNFADILKLASRGDKVWINAIHFRIKPNGGQLFVMARDIGTKDPKRSPKKLLFYIK